VIDAAEPCSVLDMMIAQMIPLFICSPDFRALVNVTFLSKFIVRIWL